MFWLLQTADQIDLSVLATDTGLAAIIVVALQVVFGRNYDTSKWWVILTGLGAGIILMFGRIAYDGGFDDGLGSVSYVMGVIVAGLQLGAMAIGVDTVAFKLRERTGFAPPQSPPVS